MSDFRWLKTPVPPCGRCHHLQCAHPPPFSMWHLTFDSGKKVLPQEPSADNTSQLHERPRLRGLIVTRCQSPRRRWRPWEVIWWINICWEQKNEAGERGKGRREAVRRENAVRQTTKGMRGKVCVCENKDRWRTVVACEGGVFSK